MARMHRPSPRAERPVAAHGWHLSPEARQHMIAEAAYYRYARRGYENGHDMEDWLAAEAAFDEASTAEESLEPFAVPELELQQSGSAGPAEDDVLKRTLKGRSLREIPRIESVEPEIAPRKE